MNDIASQVSLFLRRYPSWIAVALILVYTAIMALSYYTIFGMLGGKHLPLVLTGLTVFGLFLVYSIHHPYYLIMLMVGATYLGGFITIIDDGLIPFSLFQLLMFLSFGVFLLHRLYLNDFQIKITGLELEWFLFFSIISFSLLYAPDPFDGTIYLLRYVVLFAMMYMIINVVQRSEEVSYLLYFLIGISVMLASASIFFAVADPASVAEAVVSEGGRLDRETLFDMDPNRYAALFLLPIAFLASVTLSGWPFKYRVISVLLLFVMILGVLSTYSRSVMIAVAFMLVLIAIIYRQYQLFVWFGVLGLLSILLIPELQSFAATVLRRVGDIFAGATDDSSRIRILLGLASIYMFFDTYMLGVGFRGFSHYFTDYFTTHESIGVIMPHNIVYTIGAELGLIGLLIFGFLIWKIGMTGYQNIKISETRLQRANSVALFSAFIAMFIFYQFYGGFMYDNNLWAIISLIFAQRWLILEKK